MSVGVTDTSFRDVVPRRRISKAGDIRETSSIEADVKKQSVADIQSIIRNTTADAVNEQIALGNTPSQIIVDNRNNKNPAQAEKKTETFFGAKVSRDAMVAVQAYLLEAIQRSTSGIRRRPNQKPYKSGAIGDIDYWRWVYAPRDGSEREISGPQNFDTFVNGDALILYPKLAYATIVNNIVANSGSVAINNRGGRLQMGFLRYAAQKAKRDPRFRNLTIYAGIDPKYRGTFTNYPGRTKNEMSNKGTGFIVIRASRAKRYRSLKRG